MKSRGEYESLPEDELRRLRDEEDDYGAELELLIRFLDRNPPKEPPTPTEEDLATAREMFQRMKELAIAGNIDAAKMLLVTNRGHFLRFGGDTVGEDARAIVAKVAERAEAGDRNAQRLRRTLLRTFGEES